MHGGAADENLRICRDVEGLRRRSDLLRACRDPRDVGDGCVKAQGFVLPENELSFMSPCLNSETYHQCETSLQCWKCSPIVKVSVEVRDLVDFLNDPILPFYMYC